MSKPCWMCGATLDPGKTCLVDHFPQPVGREGRHGGACWGGRFPTEEGQARWRDRLVELQKQKATALEALERARAAQEEHDRRVDVQLSLPSVRASVSVDRIESSEQ